MNCNKKWSFLLMMMTMIKLVVAKQNPPLIQPLAIPNEIVAGQRFKIGCGLSSGSAPVEFKWYKNDKLLSSTDGIQIRTVVEDASDLIIKQIGSNDAGRYKCVVQNDAGSDASEVQVRIKGNILNCFPFTSQCALFESSLYPEHDQ